MKPSSADPNSEGVDSSASSKEPFQQPPLPPDVENLSSLKVDPDSSPKPGNLIFPIPDSQGNRPTPIQSLPADTPSEPSPNVSPSFATPEASTPLAPSAPEPSPIVTVGGLSSGSAMQPPVGPSTNPGTFSRFFKNRRVLKIALLVIAIFVVLGGAAAAAYEAIIVPNQPSSVLKSALVNTIQQSNVSFNGTYQDDISSLAFKVNFLGSVNRAAKAADLNLNLTFSGVSFPVEVRLVSGNVYFKLGNLNEIASLIKAISPSDASQITSISNQVSNKWFSVDSTLIDETGLNCYLNSSWNLQKSDINLLENMYQSNQFVKIDSTSSTTLNGQSVEEMALSVNDDKLASYANSLSGLSLVKQLNKCNKSSSSSSSSTSSLADNDTTPVSVWINKSKNEIVQLSAHSTPKDAKLKVHGNAVIDFSYNPVSISAPSNPEPILQLLSSLSSQLQSGSSNNSTIPSSNNLSQLFKTVTE